MDWCILQIAHPVACGDSEQESLEQYRFLSRWSEHGAALRSRHDDSSRVAWQNCVAHTILLELFLHMRSSQYDLIQALKTKATVDGLC